MKKLALILLGICMVLGSCKPTDKTKINYDGENTINIVLLEDRNIGASSESELVYYSDNEMVVTVDNNGVLHGKNVGEANVTIENSVNSITIKVIVSLFEEPSVDFGISQRYIRDIYGNPDYQFGDSIYIYGGGATIDDWYSYAVWRMDFFFQDNAYCESDLYINSDLKIRVDQFLDEKYHFYQTLTDTITSDGNEEIITYDLFLNSAEAANASVLIGKQENAGYYNDICLFYIPFEYNDKSLDRDIISRKRSSK